MGSGGCLVAFEFCMAVLGVRRGPIGLIAPLRLKILDSQPDSSNMGPVLTMSEKLSWVPGTLFVVISA